MKTLPSQVLPFPYQPIARIRKGNQFSAICQFSSQVLDGKKNLCSTSFLEPVSRHQCRIALSQQHDSSKGMLGQSKGGRKGSPSFPERQKEWNLEVGVLQRSLWKNERLSPKDPEVIQKENIKWPHGPNDWASEMTAADIVSFLYIFLNFTLLHGWNVALFVL